MESNWHEGAMLLMIYAILGLAFFFLPAWSSNEPDPETSGPSAAPASATATCGPPTPS